MGLAFLWLLLGLLLVPRISGHGRMLDPPARVSLWRDAVGSGCPADYNDHQHNCGGFGKQHGQNGGMCGICGDDYSLPAPRPGEEGGKFDCKRTARTYRAGQTITAKLEMTAAHKGYNMFKLCCRNQKYTMSESAKKACLDANPLADTSGNTMFPLGDRSGMITFQLKLPPGVSGKACIIQWFYRAGNNWGGGPQEEFYGCADVTITGGGGGGGGGPQPRGPDPRPRPTPMPPRPPPRPRPRPGPSPPGPRPGPQPHPRPGPSPPGPRPPQPRPRPGPSPPGPRPPQPRPRPGPSPPGPRPPQPRPRPGPSPPGPRPPQPRPRPGPRYPRPGPQPGPRPGPQPRPRPRPGPQPRPPPAPRNPRCGWWWFGRRCK